MTKQLDVTKKKKKPAKKQAVTLNLFNCKYPLFREIAQKKKWRVIEDETDEEKPWDIYWTDTSVAPERVMRLKKTQRLNHFAGMYNLCRKGGLGKHLTALQKCFPQEFGFFPETWILPAQWNEFSQQFTGKKNKTFIIKPDASCQGKGIFLTRGIENISSVDLQVAQRYLHKPLLIDGYKFDVRIYVLVTSVDPLRVFLFHEGLVRLCTEKYVSPTSTNLTKAYMHLTNYAINKTNEDFVFNTDAANSDEGSKRSMTWFRKWIAAQGHDFDLLWSRIGDVCVKSLISVLPCLQHTYRTCNPRSSSTNTVGGSSKSGSSNLNYDPDDIHRMPLCQSMCFEVLGFDIMIDHKLRPWLIEVNHSPSFGCDTPLDKEIKTDLVSKTLNIINMSSYDRRKLKAKEASAAKTRLYGPSNTENSSKAPIDIDKKIKNKLMKTEAKYTEDGSFVRIYPPAEDSEYTLAYYDEIIRASNDLYKKKAMNGSRFQKTQAKEIDSVANALLDTLRTTSKAGKSKSVRPPKFRDPNAEIKERVSNYYEARQQLDVEQKHQDLNKPRRKASYNYIPIAKRASVAKRISRSSSNNIIYYKSNQDKLKQVALIPNNKKYANTTTIPITFPSPNTAIKPLRPSSDSVRIRKFKEYSTAQRSQSFRTIQNF